MAVIFDGCCAAMKSFMHQCHEAMMVDGHHWRQQAGESKLKFKVKLLLYILLCSNFTTSACIVRVLLVYRRSSRNPSVTR